MEGNIMNHRLIEFGVDIVQQQSEDRIVVAGRCYKGPIYVGDIFTAIYQLTPTKIGIDYGPSIRAGDKSVSLTVEAIRAYQHTLDWLDEGLTAEIELSGEGAKLLESKFVLGMTRQG